MMIICRSLLSIFKMDLNKRYKTFQSPKRGYKVLLVASTTLEYFNAEYVFEYS